MRSVQLKEPATPVIGPPSLESGDRLTREEFERRYEASPHLKKAELIEGVVYMPSPVRVRRHGSPNARLVAWLVVYESATPGTLAADNATARLDLDNEPQPDGMLLILPDHGGQAVFSSDDYVEGAPELAAEIAADSVSIDLNQKLNVYRRNRVQEYIVWRVLDQRLDWFRLRGSQFELLQPDHEGIVRGEVFPGLWLDVPALLRGDMKRVLDIVTLGTASREHAAFVERLQKR